MRYLTLLAVAVCLIGAAPSAAWGQGPTFGIKGGVNGSTLRVDDTTNPNLQVEGRTSAVVGAFVYCGGDSWFALQGEVTYSRNGATVQDQTGATTIDIDYLRVPILVMGRITSPKSPITPILYAGPQVSFQMRCQTTVQGTGQEGGCDRQAGDPIQTNTVEFGLVFGGGVQSRVKRFLTHADIRYNLGLSNINGGTTSSTVTVNNRGWSLMVGIGLTFG